MKNNIVTFMTLPCMWCNHIPLTFNDAPKQAWQIQKKWPCLITKIQTIFWGFPIWIKKNIVVYCMSCAGNKTKIFKLNLRNGWKWGFPVSHQYNQDLWNTVLLIIGTIRPEFPLWNVHSKNIWNIQICKICTFIQFILKHWPTFILSNF